MLLVRQLTVFFLIALCLVCPCLGQQHTEFLLNNDLQGMIERMESVNSAAEAMETSNADQDGIPIMDLYKYLIPIAGFYQVLQNWIANMDNERCAQDLKYAFNQPLANDRIGLKMLDSFGKPESGVLEGNVRWLGSYHECITIRAPPNENFTAGDFKGQYCSLSVTVGAYGLKAPVIMGVCLPDSCGSVSMENITSPNLNVTQKVCQPTSKKMTSAAIVMICVFSFLLFLSLVGSSITLYEYIAKILSSQDAPVQYTEQVNGDVRGIQIQDPSSSDAHISDKGHNKDWYGKAKEFFNCFCVFTNGAKLLDTSGTEGQLLCLHGIRFLSMAWVIICHVYGFLLSNLANLKETLTTINTWPFQIVLNGFYSVDSFFLLSGFLVAHLYFQECAKKRKVSWLYFYIHRYVRLTPVFALTLGFVTTLYYYLGTGPIWQINEIDPICQETWYYNMLYSNNFIDPSKNCMPWSWYLANDMQFFIFSPILLITLWRWPKIGYAVLGLFMSATIAANLGITYHYNLLSGYGKVEADVWNFAASLQGSLVDFNFYYKLIYEKPYTRMGPYLLGIALAYFLFKRKQDNAKKISMITLVCGWIIAPVAALACLFCLYDRKLSLTESAFYNALGRLSFTGGISWVIFTCLNKQAEPVNKILSFKMFIPLSRLTYCAYLIHPLVVGAYFNSMKVTIHFSQITMVTLFLGQLVQTYFFAFIVSVLFESPLIRLEKVVRTSLLS